VAIGIALPLVVSADEWLRYDQLRHAAIIERIVRPSRTA